MKILFYINSLAPAGGIERVVAKHIEFFAGRCEAVVLTKDSGQSFYPLPSNVERETLGINCKLNMNSRLSRALNIGYQLATAAVLLRRWLREVKPDYIYVATPSNLLEVTCAQRSCGNVIVTEHSSFEAYNVIYSTVARLLYRRVRVLAVPTTRDVGLYKAMGIASQYIPNPLSFYPKESSNLRTKCVLNVGRLTSDKDHLSLLKIWSLVRNEFPDWKLQIFGEGEMQAAMREFMSRNQLNGSVVLSAPTKDIQREFLASSIFVLTSRAEGFGMVLAEAMSCGVPCIAYDCPSGPRDIIDHEANGYLVPPGNVGVFATRLASLMRSEELRLRFGAAAKASIAKFEASAVCERWEAVRQSLLARIS